MNNWKLKCINEFPSYSDIKLKFDDQNVAWEMHYWHMQLLKGLYPMNDSMYKISQLFDGRMFSAQYSKPYIKYLKSLEKLGLTLTSLYDRLKIGYAQTSNISSLISVPYTRNKDFLFHLCYEDMLQYVHHLKSLIKKPDRPIPPTLIYANDKNWFTHFKDCKTNPSSDMKSSNMEYCDSLDYDPLDYDSLEYEKLMLRYNSSIKELYLGLVQDKMSPVQIMTILETLDLVSIDMIIDLIKEEKYGVIDIIVSDKYTLPYHKLTKYADLHNDMNMISCIASHDITIDFTYILLKSVNTVKILQTLYLINKLPSYGELTSFGKPCHERTDMIRNFYTNSGLIPRDILVTCMGIDTHTLLVNYYGLTNQLYTQLANITNIPSERLTLNILVKFWDREIERDEYGYVEIERNEFIYRTSIKNMSNLLLGGDCVDSKLTVAYRKELIKK